MKKRLPLNQVSDHEVGAYLGFCSMKRHGVFLLLLEQDASLSQTSLSLSCQSSLARAKRVGERTKRETPVPPLPCRKDVPDYYYVR